MTDREDVCRTSEGMLGLTGAGIAIELGPVTIRGAGGLPSRHVRDPDGNPPGMSNEPEP